MAEALPYVRIAEALPCIRIAEALPCIRIASLGSAHAALRPPPLLRSPSGLRSVNRV
jgi:hypothetical protein